MQSLEFRSNPGKNCLSYFFLVTEIIAKEAECSQITEIVNLILIRDYDRNFDVNPFTNVTAV